MLADLETGIANHPEETAAAYAEVKLALPYAEAPNTHASVGLTRDELILIHQYLVASAFAAAWYHLAGDKPRRDTLSFSAIALAGGFGGINANDLMNRYLTYESKCAEVLRSRGIIDKFRYGCATKLSKIGILIFVMLVLLTVT